MLLVKEELFRHITILKAADLRFEGIRAGRASLQGQAWGRREKRKEELVVSDSCR